MGDSSETRLHGRSVSRGIAGGKAVCLYGKRRQFFRVPVAGDAVSRETGRFRSAVGLAKRQLERLANADSGSLPQNVTGVLEFHRAVLDDPILLDAVEQKIQSECVNAEWAVKLVTDAYILQHKEIPDERLRERYKDIEDVTDRILGALGGASDRIELEPGMVIVTHELNPSTLIELSTKQPAAIVTEQGGWTSHTNILARELGIPAVTGIKAVCEQIRSGDEVIVDAYTGEVIARPLEKKVVDAAAANGRPKPNSARSSNGIFHTLDGREIAILANADLPDRYISAEREGAKGVGLFRSEFCFRRFHDFPEEEEQYRAYREIAEMTREFGVRIRTFDISADDLFDHQFAYGKNPALGLRGVRLSLELPEIFRTQIRALLRASFDTSIDVILPMVSDVEEIREARRIIAEEREFLDSAGIPIGEPRLGAMIEVPAALLTIDGILNESDVICLGTNDLVQYLLAVDRDNEAVSKWFNSLHQAVLKAIGTVLQAAERSKKQCIVCGEIAGSPFYVPLLVGLGAKRLSMNPTSVARVRDVIEGLAYEEAIELIREIRTCSTATETESVVSRFSSANWKHLAASETD
jgi:phosphotransferase system enzyme I (PtsI)